MKRINGLVGVLVLFQAGFAPSQKLPITITITTPATSVRRDTAVRIDVSVTNVSHHSIDITRSPGQPEAANRLMVYDTKGRLLPRLSTAPDGGSLIGGVPLEPDKSIVDSFIANNYVDLGKPGTYRIQVFHQEMLLDEKKHKVRESITPSNSLTIVVTK
jgi:hypothetical protein